MTLTELLTYLGDHCGHPILEGTVEETLQKVQAGTHPEPLAAEIVERLAGAAQAGSVSRADATTALGSLRLRYMKDDAPVAGFRMVERVVHTIDGAFNDEALRLRAR